jgi:hypothetical protein
VSSDLKFVGAVTAKHGRIFAKIWLERSIECFELGDAFVESRVIAKPRNWERAAKAGYHDIEDEILELTFAAVKPAVAEAFVKAAAAVLARERRRYAHEDGKSE